MVFGGNGGDQSLPTEYKGGMRKGGGGGKSLVGFGSVKSLSSPNQNPRSSPQFMNYDQSIVHTLRIGRL